MAIAPGLGKTAARGVGVTLSATAAKMILQMGAVVVLARLLTASDYGLIAMVMAVVGVADILRDVGLSAAAIQAKVLSREQRDNLFWLNTAAGAAIMLIVLAGAPLVSALYGRSELTAIASALAPVFLMSGMATQYRAHLNRHMEYKKIAMAEVTAPAVALAVAVLLAINGAGYWALVAQQLTSALTLLFLFSILGKWVPRRFHRGASMRGLVTFGFHLAGSQLVGYAAKNVDTLTIGAMFGPIPVGFYNRATQLILTPLAQVRTPSLTVALPTLSRVRDSRERTDRLVQRGQIGLGLTLISGLGFVVGAATPLVHVALGEGWLETIPYLRLLAIAAGFQTLAYVGYWVYLSHGLTADLLRYSLISAPIKAICVLVGALLAGPVGVAAGIVVSAAFEWPLSFYWLNRSANISVRPLVIGALRVLTVATAIALVSWGTASLLSAQAPWIALLAAAVAGMLAFAGFSVFGAYRRDIKDLMRMAQLAIDRR